MQQTFHQYAYIFSQQSFKIQLATILMIAAMVVSIITFTVGPIIWNFIIVPKIEKRLKMKLKISAWTDTYLFGWLFCFQMELFPVILWKYIALKRGKDPNKKRFHPLFFTLATVDYDIRQATRLEIFMAFFTPLCSFLAFVFVMFSTFLLTCLKNN